MNTYFVITMSNISMIFISYFKHNGISHYASGYIYALIWYKLLSSILCFSHIKFSIFNTYVPYNETTL